MLLNGSNKLSSCTRKDILELLTMLTMLTTFPTVLFCVFPTAKYTDAMSKQLGDIEVIRKNERMELPLDLDYYR